MDRRPRKLNGRDERKILRALKSLRQMEGNYSTAQIMSMAGISARQVSTRTVRRYLNKNGYFSLQARKKGLLSEADCKKRLKFAKQMKSQYPPEVWKDHSILCRRCKLYLKKKAKGVGFSTTLTRMA